MSARRKSMHGQKAAVRAGKNAEARKVMVRQELSSQELEETREKWVQERRADLDRVFDVHDSLVRETFHLEKFVSLLSYDPKIAKADHSDVFQRFQAQYDLVDHTASAGPSRRTTRRAHTERLQGLTVHASPVASTSDARHVRTVEDSPSTAFWDIKAEAKSKGKQGQGGLLASPQSPASHGRKGKGREVVETPLAAPVFKEKSTRRAAPAPAENTQHDSSLDGLAPPPPRKKRRLTQEMNVTPRRGLRALATMPTLDASALAERPSNAAPVRQGAMDPPPSPIKHPIPRVKLIVRRPPTMFSSPLQKPPPPVFGGSLERALTSFTFHNDHEASKEEIEASIADELEFWRKVDALRRKGRLLDQHSYAFKEPSPKDAWADIVSQIERFPKFVDGREMAANVAGKVQKYWQGENKAEEARMRKLALTTASQVIDQWKKAVYHVRQQERLEWEAEERRRGQEHLNAILDQSGQILAVQTRDLARDSRSRSRSVSTHELDRTPGGTDVEDEAKASDAGSSHDNSSDSESTAEDEGISMLVPDLEVESASQAGRSPRSASVEVDMDLGTTSEEEADADLPPRSPTHSNHRERTPMVVNGEEEPHVESLASTPVQYGKGKGKAISMDLDLEEVFPSSPTAIVGDAGTSHSPHVDEFDDPNHPAKSLQVTQGQASAEVSIRKDLMAGDDLESTNKTNGLETPRDSVVSADTPSVIATPIVDEDIPEEDVEEDTSIPAYLRPYAVTAVEWDPEAKVKSPLLLRGTLRPYQQGGLEWLASLHSRNLNGILADEMGLGKTIQTIALLAYLACDRGIWGPHLIIVPTSVLLNWEMEFKKFLPGFNVLSYHGNTKQRRELRQGWNNKYHFNVCITSYTLASRDSHVFKRKRWYYMILDEAHMIKNFKSQRWNILLMFRSWRRLLLTGTPLQNNLTELWALLQFLMSGTNFANLKEFGEWFANPVEKAIEQGAIDDETQQRVSKLHTVLRPYLLRRLKRDVEKELPQKYEHIVMCPLSKRQRFLYDEFMARAQTRHDLQSGVYQKIANILMQLRKVVNHPDLFEVRPIVTSFAMQRSAIADYEIRELLVRRQLLAQSSEDHVNLDFLGLQFIDSVGCSEIAARETRRLDGTSRLPMIGEVPGEPPPRDTRTIAGYRTYRAYQQRAAAIARWAQIGYINGLRCSRSPVYSAETLAVVRRCHVPLLPLSVQGRPLDYLSTPERARHTIKSYAARADEMAPLIDRFAFATPNVVARDMHTLALPSLFAAAARAIHAPDFDEPLHRASVKLQIAFPDPSLLQYDCGKLQVLARLLRERKAGGHRILIFTQMTRILDILETFLNLHGYLYLRLDGATKIEDRQYITERFNSDPRIFCFISSSRSGGVGINLTGADTVIFYDSDFNPQMDRQCEDRAHRIGQIRDVHIYRFISQHTVEEALLRKANQKRSLDDLVIQKGEFDWRTLFSDTPESALTRALGEFEDVEDAQAAQIAAQEEMEIQDEDAQDFGNEGGAVQADPSAVSKASAVSNTQVDATEGVDEEVVTAGADGEQGEVDEEDEEEGRTIDDYMIDFVNFDSDFFSGAEWNVKIVSD